MNDDHAKRYTELVDATGPEDEIPDEAVDIGEDLQAGGPMCHALDPRYTVNTTDYPGGILKDVPDEECTIEARFQNILRLGTIPKAYYVVPDFVRKRREHRGADKRMTQEDKDREDVLLDFLLFLAEKEQRAALFRYVGSK
ncbi:hypothetical protein BT96DRAFT_978885 [Gymnopus androsaceus JB14]|uniref:Uncharacterized protein n=1 Tax=Gymnopus androsaceus JB14 TaxID=1447944 RepID=A0A6A4H776_9AGAR|nr:hypothetical protein BT96DRAFT_978885 [Gymnopus androsaceus JB14]